MKPRRGRSIMLASSLALLVSLALPAWATAAKPLPRCGHLNFPASGQTTAYLADKNNGAGGDAVPDDGTVQAGTPLSYVDNGDGTLTDLNTGLMWEMKDLGSLDGVPGALHDADNTYRWSGDGTQETIWDWLDDVNVEGFAGHSDWRIPNVKELQSIVDHQVFNPSIDPVFGDTGSLAPPSTVFYWSSSTVASVTACAVMPLRTLMPTSSVRCGAAVCD